MGTFIAAYLVIWLAVAGYVALLGVRQHRLAREIDELRAEFTEERSLEGATSKAA
jgi:CcmD family protein